MAFEQIEQVIQDFCSTQSLRFGESEFRFSTIDYGPSYGFRGVGTILGCEFASGGFRLHVKQNSGSSQPTPLIHTLLREQLGLHMICTPRLHIKHIG